MYDLDNSGNLHTDRKFSSYRMDPDIGNRLRSWEAVHRNKFSLDSLNTLNLTVTAVYVDLTILTFRFEVTRWLFWNGPHKTAPLLAPPSPIFRTTATGGRLIHDVRLNVYYVHMCCEF
ncbi:hypothetical protein AVEN_86868-1 [Araneus ventricosus]|uniref:Uncharacterized protein n=1 Tax=Araneus ventricosus TaxID=182803 RepID=A0A4Y2QQ78_ARAVE|nr:hypothetical protein AVEN_86868-1 [Araneus ventricosus]